MNQNLQKSCKNRNDEVPQFSKFDVNVIEISQQLKEDTNNFIDEVYLNVSKNILLENILNSIILATLNDNCTLINTDILNQIPSEQHHITVMLE